MAAAPPRAPLGALRAAQSPSPLLRRRAAPLQARRRRAAHAGGSNGNGNGNGSGNGSTGVTQQEATAARAVASTAAAADATAAAPRTGVMAAWLAQLRRDGALVRVTQAEVDSAAVCVLKAKARASSAQQHSRRSPRTPNAPQPCAHASFSLTRCSY
jgi:hypothetical protein